MCLFLKKVRGIMCLFLKKVRGMMRLFLKKVRGIVLAKASLRSYNLYLILPLSSIRAASKRPLYREEQWA